MGPTILYAALAIASGAGAMLLQPAVPVNASLSEIAKALPKENRWARLLSAGLSVIAVVALFMAILTMFSRR